MSSLRSLIRSGMTCAVAAALLGCLYPAAATAQIVRGQGEIPNGPGLSPSHVSVNAGLDDQGVAYGRMTWVGDASFGGPRQDPALFVGGAADPYIMEVTAIVFDGNTAYVEGRVVASPRGSANGISFTFAFTDNSGTGEPDEINGTPIDAGNITVDD